MSDESTKDVPHKFDNALKRMLSTPPAKKAAPKAKKGKAPRSESPSRAK